MTVTAVVTMNTTATAPPMTAPATEQSHDLLQLSVAEGTAGIYYYSGEKMEQNHTLHLVQIYYTFHRLTQGVLGAYYPSGGDFYIWYWEVVERYI